MSTSTKWENVIKELFSTKNTFFTASELINVLSEKLEISREYSRQIIKRAVNKKFIKNSHPFKFKNGQYVYMGVTDTLDLKTLINISKLYKPSMYRVLTLLFKEDKLLSFYEARKAAATPVENIDRYKLTRLDDEIKELIHHDYICTVKDSEKNIIYITTKEMEDSPLLSTMMKNHYEKMRLDSMFIPDIIRWLKEHNLIDSDMLLYRRTDNPSIGAKHNDFLWDFYSYTNTTGFSINTGKKDKQTLLVMDVLVHRPYSKEDLDGFYNRIQSVRHSTHSEARKVLPIIIFNEIPQEVKKEIRRLQILNFSLPSVFGMKVSELIQRLTDIRKASAGTFHTEDQSSDIIEDIEKTLKLMDESGQIDNLQNIKGALFESLMYVVISNIFPHNSRLNHSKMIKPYEYDVIVQRDEEVIIIELKGLKNSTIINLGDYKTNATVKWFFGNTLPHAKRAYTIPSSPFEYNKTKIKACYITSANFSEEALHWLEEINKSKLKPETLDCFYDRKRLLKLIKTHENLSSLRKSTAFIDILEKFYLKEQ
ncbi:hypothetical protein [Paenibacillus silagei]|uniref:NERD domain-containing protein n=1 Tax=Paenibacillus silagei TaxID=1670801 RepID=A0ABS4NMC6_9BACL|nr:hypothetical protein [Paenibacillus silagei]MBP2110502.1 hypothetical protein [Paenibacillus silagei]